MKSILLLTVLMIAGCSTAPKSFSGDVTDESNELTPVEDESRQPANSDSPSAEKFQEWARAVTPTKGSTRIIGGYASGCIAGAVPLPLESKNYVVMRPSRRAFYGDTSLVKYVQRLGARANSAGLERILVEDLSRPRGGPVAKGHGSHQTGLDVDLLLTFAWPNMSEIDRESFIGPSFVVDRKRLDKTWTADQAKLVELAASDTSVARIFVSPAIKRHFCDSMPTATWLSKLRAWWGHEDHIHVRLNCPANAPECRKQAPISSADSGCGSDLAWWLSSDADQKWSAIQAFWASGEEKKFPIMPKACELVKDAE